MTLRDASHPHHRTQAPGEPEAVIRVRDLKVAFGDKVIGTNHTLPTSGTAKFSSALSVCDKYSFQSDPRFAWVDEMENDELYRKIISLPERDIDLLTLIAFEGYSQREVAEIRGIAPAAICKKIAKLKKLLYGG